MTNSQLRQGDYVEINDPWGQNYCVYVVRPYLFGKKRQERVFVSDLPNQHHETSTVPTALIGRIVSKA